MPFKKGENKYQLLGGRKGYELEQQQLRLMREIVSKDLEVLKRVYDGIATERDFKNLSATQARVQKYLDKLHATKNEMDLTGNIQIEEVKKNTNWIKSLIEKYDDKTTGNMPGHSE